MTLLLTDYPFCACDNMALHEKSAMCPFGRKLVACGKMEKRPQRKTGSLVPKPQSGTSTPPLQDEPVMMEQQPHQLPPTPLPTPELAPETPPFSLGTATPPWSSGTSTPPLQNEPVIKYDGYWEDGDWIVTGADSVLKLRYKYENGSKKYAYWVVYWDKPLIVPIPAIGKYKKKTLWYSCQQHGYNGALNLAKRHKPRKIHGDS